MFLKITPSIVRSLSIKPNYRSKYFRLYLVSNTISKPRLGIQITKKAVNLAVIRNQVRRKIKEDFRLIFKSLPPQDFLIIISSKITSEKHQISDILMQEWKKSIESLSKLQ